MSFLQEGIENLNFTGWVQSLSPTAAWNIIFIIGALASTLAMQYMLAEKGPFKKNKKLTGFVSIVINIFAWGFVARHPEILAKLSGWFLLFILIVLMSFIYMLYTWYCDTFLNGKRPIWARIVIFLFLFWLFITSLYALDEMLGGKDTVINKLAGYIGQDLQTDILFVLFWAAIIGILVGLSHLLNKATHNRANTTPDTPDELLDEIKTNMNELKQMMKDLGSIIKNLVNGGAN